MTVKSKLIANALLMASGMLVIAAVSLFCVTRIRSSIEQLTDKSTPLHLNTLILQQSVEKVSSDFLRVGMSQDPAEVKALSEAIAGRVRQMEEISREVREKGASVSGIEPSVFREIEKTVVRVVEQRFKDVALFGTESKVITAELQKSEQAMKSLGSQIRKMEEDALASLNASSQANLKVNGNIKKLLTLQTRLKDLEILISDLDLVKNKFRVAPVRERLKAVAELAWAVPYEEGDFPVVKESRDAILQLADRLGREGGGLISLRSDILASPDNRETEAYTSLKQAVQKGIEEQSQKIANTSDTLELQIVKDRERMRGALAFQRFASEVMSLGSSVEIGVQELSATVRLVMLSSTGEALSTVASDIKGLLERTKANTDRIRGLLARADQRGMGQTLSAVEDTLRTAAASIDRIVATKQGVIASDAAMQKALESARAIAVAQSKRGEEQVRTVGESQRDVLASVRRTLEQSGALMALILLVSIAAIGASGLISWRIIRSITRPLVTLVGTLREMAAGGGDLTRTLPVDSRDEVGQLADSFNRFVERLRGTARRIQSVSADLGGATEKIRESSRQVMIGALEQAGSLGKSSEDLEGIDQAAADIAQNTRSLVTASDDISAATLEMGATTEEIAEQARKLFGHIAEVSSFIADMSAMSEQNKDSVQTLSSSAKATAGAVGQLDASVKAIGESAEITNRISQEVAEDTQLGKEAVDASIQGIRGLSELADRSSEAIQTLGARANAIGSVLTVIEDVAGQTSLLALNAAIIAAQAGGDSGKGFAVVADEIRDLAERTAASTQEIATIIESLQTEAAKAVDAMQISRERARSEVERSQSAGRVLDKINVSALKSREQVHGIVGAVRQQAQETRQIAEAVDLVASTLGQIAASAEQQSRAAQRLTAASRAMEAIASEVTCSTGEQANGSRQIGESMERIRSMVKGIDDAIHHQTHRSGLVVASVSDVRAISEDNIIRSGELDQVVDMLSGHVATLKEEMGTFKT